MALVIAPLTFIISFATSYGPRWLYVLGFVLLGIATMIQGFGFLVVIINTYNSVETELNSKTQQFDGAYWSVVSG